MHDLVIRGGSVADGTGAPIRTADVAITDGTVTEVGDVEGPARREIDADGALVTPGFVDVHTHYDGQASWDDLLTPSCWHGVTTVVMGNCGVGFAPVAPDRHEWLIGLMEGVEDIPGAALSEGIEWGWESFPEYLDALAARSYALDIGAQVPHGPVRAYVMGERGARNEPATPADIEAMAAIVREGILAGALGFSTSRTLAHRAIDGEPVPGTFAAEDELFGIGSVLGELGTGVFELAPAGALGEDLAAPEREIDWMRRLSAACGRPVSFVLTQNVADPKAWRRQLDLAAEARSQGVDLRPQVHARTVSILLGFQTFHPLNFTPAWGETGLGLQPWEEQVQRIRHEDGLRERLVHELHALADDPIVAGFMGPERVFLLGDPPDYEPGPERSVAGIAAARGADRWEVFVDLLLQDDGRELLNSPVLNYADGNLDAAGEMLAHPATAFGLGDGGAHAGQTCDASSTTYLLSYWARDRVKDRLSVEHAVRKMTQATASMFGLGDRGVLAPGMVADVNVIDLPRLQLHRPVKVADLPGGASRLLQRADGYVATIKSGEVTFEGGEATAARPGRLLPRCPLTLQLDAARDVFGQLDANAAAVSSGAPMSRASLELLDDAGLVGLMVPRAVGGVELPLADIVDVYEEVSRADGSTGWCHFAADCTAAYFGAYLPDSGVEEIFAGGVPLMAGQFAPNGTAVASDGELVIDGDFQFGSGIAHASWAGAGVLTAADDGEPSEYLFACFPASEAELLGNWDVLGLQATASYDYRLRDVHVPSDRAFDFFAPVVHRGGPMHALGVLPLTAAGHAGWALGVTRRCLDEVAAVAASTTRLGATSSLATNERFLYELGTLEGRFRAGRAWVREACTAAEAEAARDGSVSTLTANLVREACRHVNQQGADIARQAYLLTGTRALRDGPIQRCFRDLHAGSQHFFASPSAAIDLATALLADG